MTAKLLTGNAAAAWGARLAGVDYLPAFPITPQTEIIETMARWSSEGKVPCKMVMFESEHSMITAAGAAASTGVRVFSATSSQGLLHGMEMLYTVAGWRVPFVLANVSRGLASPITLEADHNDVMAARDCGFLQFHAATCQEVVDLMLMAYRVSEDRAVRLPVLVNLDGFYLSFTREPVVLPDEQAVAKFLPPFHHADGEFRAGHPTSRAVAVLGSGPYSYFRYEAHLAALEALPVFDNAAAEFEQAFGRRYRAVDCYKADDAEVVIVMIGSFSTKARDAVDQLRKAGHKVGLVRPVLLRPFPEEELRKALIGKKGVAVIDQNLAPGRGGVLHMEVRSTLFGSTNAPAVVCSYIGGLGGRDIGPAEFYRIVEETTAAAGDGKTPP
ncbi:MAG: pyruvate synthase, partial [Alphaproteobacteria bacterium]|nr:pyruvate synthase [Alphaproteobacteria bacterium]